LLRILLTNDDGINAEGLEILEKIASHFSDDVWIVAPETDQSGMAHSITLSNPLRLRKLGDRRFCVRGTPTDCVLMALKHIMPEAPDLILSGVNIGGNLANDVTYSGTVAGAIEGSLQGILSVALSQEFRADEGRRKVHWTTAETFAPPILKKLLNLERKSGLFYNLNFPACEPSRVKNIKIASLGKLSHVVNIDERVDGRGLPYFWMHFQRAINSAREDSDIQAVRNDFISLCPLQLDLTDYHMKRTLEELFKEVKL